MGSPETEAGRVGMNNPQHREVTTYHEGFTSGNTKLPSSVYAVMTGEITDGATLKCKPS